jgi:putative addiction module component (TIGR02574 family)
MRIESEFSALFELPPAERLQLIEDLWDSLLPREAEIPIPDWVAGELRARKALFDANPQSGLTWEQVVADLDKP